MADQNLAVAIIFNAVDNLGGTLKNIDSDFAGLSGRVEAFAEPFANFTDSLLKAEAALAAVGVAMVAISVDKAGKFTDSVKEIGTLFGGTSEQVGKFGTEIENYAATSTQSIDSINGAIYEAISSGVKYEDSIAFVSEAEKLAVAGRADLTEVTNVLTGTLNAYGAATGEAANYTDDLLTAVNLGKTTVPELAQSLSQVTPIASAAGVPFGDLSAAIAAVTAAGVPTSEAMTKIRGVIETFISPSKAASEAASALGISLDTTTLKSLGMDGALRKIYEATGGTTEGLSKIFTSTEALQGALILGADKTGLFSDALKQMGENTGTTEKAFTAMSENYDVAIQRMSNAADIGVSDAIGKIFASIGTGIDAGAFDPILNALQSFGATAAETLAGIAEDLPAALEKLDFSELLRAFSDLGDEAGTLFKDLFGDIDLDTPEGLAEALQKVVDIVTGLIDVTRGIAEQFEPLFQAMGSLADRSGEAGEEANVMAGKFLGSMKMIADFGLAIGGLATAFQDSGTNIRGFVDDVMDVADGLFNGFQAVFDSIMGVLGTFVKDFVGVIDAMTLGAFHDRLSEISGNLDTVITDFADSAARNGGEAVDAFKKIGDSFDEIGDADAQQQMKDSAAALEKIGFTAVETAEQTGKFEPIDLGDLDPIAEAMKRLGMSATETAAATDKMTGAAQAVSTEWATAEERAQGYKAVMDDMGRVTFVQVGSAAASSAKDVDEQGKAMDEAAKKADKAQEAAAKYALEMEKLASNERIKFIEATVQLNIAELESQTEQVKAAFSSIDNTVNSTGDLINNLFGKLQGTDSISEKFDIMDMIHREEERRQKALDLQEKLIEAQIRYMDKRTEALGKTDALFRIEADGLEQPLEQIWREIMRKIQVKASEEGLEMLLGAMG